MRLKATFTVTAGVIPGEPMDNHTKQWQYTSADYEADGQLPPMPEGHRIDMCGPLDQPHMSRFTRMLIESQRYATELSHPAYLNWVHHSWMWV